MRLGAPLFGVASDPGEWALALKAKGYSAAFCPVGADATGEVIAAYVKAAADNDIVIAEVGAWSNPMSRDATQAAEALAHCQRQLDLAERLGARCCVNITGSRGEKWDGPHPDNLSEETFDLIVAQTRAIIDAVQPTRTYYTLETMPWVFPDSPDSYLALIRAIDRPQFAVHLDPVNIVCSPQRYYRTGDLIRDCFAKLGPWIRSCHAKDILLAERLTVHLDEVRPGLGALDYRVYLSELAKLEGDTALMIEHLPNEAEYDAAAQHIRGVAAEIGVSFR